MSDEKKKPRKEVPDEISIELSKPIRLESSDGDTVHAEINLKEPTLGQLTAFIKKSKKDDALDCMRWLISEISGIPMTALNQIGTRDYYKLQEYLMAFLTPPEEDDPEGNAVGSQ